jgi:hypothetical protein
MGSDLTGDNYTTFDDLRCATAQKTNAAAAEGQRDVHTAIDISSSYLDQAKSMAGDIVTSAQVRSQLALLL